MACGKNDFTVTWRIENYNFAYSSIQSPSFVIDSAKYSSWRFEIAPKSVLKRDHIAFHAQRKVSDAFGINFVASFYTGDDSSSLFYEGHFGIEPHMVFSSACYVPHCQVYEKIKGAFVEPATLTIRCRMYKTKGSFTEVGRCFARTRILVERTAFVGFVEQFSSIDFDLRMLTTKSCKIKEDEVFSVDIFLDGDMRCKETLWLGILPFKEDYVKHCKGKFFLLDSSGTKTKCGEKEITFSSASEDWTFELFITKGFLKSRKTQFLPNDTLTLKCEFIFSTGIEYERIEDSEFGNLASVNKKQLKIPSAMEDLLCLYKEGILCDITLQTQTDTLKAHKSILSARSSVFRSMFTIDMREKTTDCIVIEDLDADTIRRMLFYLYSDDLEDLDWEKAKNLYYAADKYNIIGLKQRCSEFLKSSLLAANCSDLLVLAYTHQDSELKKSVQEYIAEHREEVFLSDEWKIFEKSHPGLSIETFHFVYLGN